MVRKLLAQYIQKERFVRAKVAISLLLRALSDEKMTNSITFYAIFTVLIIENEEKSVILQCVFV